jgi:hypothetical protein
MGTQKQDAIVKGANENNVKRIRDVGTGVIVPLAQAWSPALKVFCFCSIAIVVM